MEDKKKSFKDLENIEEIKNYIKSKQYGHIKYCHYTTIDNIDSILSSSTLLFGSMSSVNDKQDGRYGENLYSLCFAGTYSENIPLWYLYSGINGKGGRLSLAKGAFNTWLGLDKMNNKIKIQPKLYKHVNGKYVETNDWYLSDEDYEVIASDIIYISSENGKVRIKYNAEVKNNFTDDVDKLKNEFEFFYKYISWFYEKEFRIVIVVKNEELNNKLKEKIENNIYLYRLGFSIEKIMPHIELTLAPEVNESEKDRIITMEGIKNFFKHKVNNSLLTGQVKMNLLSKYCANCKEKCINKDCKDRKLKNGME